MEKGNSSSKKILVLGLIGITAVLFTVISDLILLGRPVSAYSFFRLGTESMADLSYWRITVGVFLGIIALPFQMAGIISLYYGLKPAGKLPTLAALIINAHALIMGVAFHASYAFIGCGWKLYHEDLGSKIIADMVERFEFYWMVIIIIMMFELIISSFIYVRSIMSGKTLYSKWMALINPICVFVFMLPFILWIPAPVGGYVAPAYLNLSTMVFMCCSTIVIYKRLKKEEGRVQTEGITEVSQSVSL